MRRLLISSPYPLIPSPSYLALSVSGARALQLRQAEMDEGQRRKHRRDQSERSVVHNSILNSGYPGVPVGPASANPESKGN